MPGKASSPRTSRRMTAPKTSILLVMKVRQRCLSRSHRGRDGHGSICTASGGRQPAGINAKSSTDRKSDGGRYISVHQQVLPRSKLLLTCGGGRVRERLRGPGMVSPSSATSSSAAKGCSPEVARQPFERFRDAPWVPQSTQYSSARAQWDEAYENVLLRRAAPTTRRGPHTPS